MKIITNTYKHKDGEFSVKVTTCNKRTATTENLVTGETVTFNRAKFEYMIKKGVFTLVEQPAAEKPTVIGYNSTVGLDAIVPGYPTRKLVRIGYDEMSDGTFKVYVKSGHTLSQMSRCGVEYLSHTEINERKGGGNIEEFKSFANLFGISI